MKILVIGNGGREHALAWKAAQSAGVEEVLVAPGNAGTAREPHCRNIDVAADDLPALAALARRERVALTIVGPEVPLVAGVRDLFDAEGLACFGPSRAAAQLEGSKAFTKEFLARWGIPTAAYATFTELAAAEDYIRARGAPIVVKADGLAAGKGVVVARTVAEALAAARDMLAGDAFGAAGARVVIEEFLEGEEASFICLCDGRRAVPFASAQDHKARRRRRQGPQHRWHGRLFARARGHARRARAGDARGNRADRSRAWPRMAIPTSAFLYAGLMITPDGRPR